MALCFAGLLHETPVPLVLHRIVQARAKGTLTLARPSERIRLSFVGGELKAANSTRAGMRIGDALLLRGMVPEEEFEEVLLSARGGRGSRLGKVLVERGLLTQEALEAEIQNHFREIFFSCFAWRGGEFAFLPSFGELDSDVSLDMPTAALIIEGVRRVTGEAAEPGALGDPAFFGRATPLMTELPSLRLSSEEAYFLSLCDGSTRLRDILRLGRSRTEAAQTLYTLLACGLVEFVSSPAAPPDAGVPFLRDADAADGATEDDDWPDPDARDARARTAFGDALAALADGDVCRAVALLQECVHISPYNSEYRVRLGDVLSRQSLWRRRALTQYREALGLDPSREDALMRVAELLLEEEKTEAAREIARGLVARHPDTPEYRELLDRCAAPRADRRADDLPPIPGPPGTARPTPTR
ncbi:MAG TPA: DUF4388 domain-containing protein [Thermoanaerobaculia bacterium]|nr:DUF4388 domain-containing protein [Thermoanaerobaculia bacterium]